uniref:Uncharacterized protein n=1 Tax=Ditylenchus dipsaci TaxID=166011 RepID=A0A915DWW0_9BILA
MCIPLTVNKAEVVLAERVKGESMKHISIAVLKQAVPTQARDTHSPNIELLRTYDFVKKIQGWILSSSARSQSI